MPIYEFRCENCGRVLEALRRMGEGPDGLSCPDCASTALRQVLSRFAALSGRESAPRTERCGAPLGSCGGGGCGMA